jgi:PAS domain S-box-containing protein
MLGIAALTVGVLLGYLLYAERREIDDREGERLQIQARVIGENLERQLEGVNNALAGIRDDLLQFGDKGMSVSPSRRLKTLSDAMTGVRTLLVANADGMALASNRDVLIGQNFSEREWYKAPRERPNPTMLYVSAPFETVLGVVSVNVTRAVVDPRGEFAGVVSASLDPEYFNVLLRSVLYAPDMRVAVAHGDGKAFVFMPPREGTIGMNFANPGSFFVRHRDSGQIATLLRGIAIASGDERLMATRTVNRVGVPMDRPLIIHVSRSVTAMHLSWRVQSIAYGTLFGLFALIAGIVLYLLQRRRRMADRLAAARETERRESAERLELALAGADLGLWDVDVRSGRQVCNERWYSMLGYRENEIEARQSSWEKLVHPDDLPSVRAAMEAHLRGETQAYEIEHRLRHKDGRWLWILSRGKVVERDAAGTAVRVVGTHLDVTERKRLEQALQAQTERLLIGQRTAGVIIMDWDVLTDELAWSDSPEWLRGPVPEGGKYPPYKDQIHPEDLDRFLAVRAEGIETLQPGKNEYRIVRTDGKIIWLHSERLVLPGADGKAARMIIALQDISARKQDEARQLQLAIQLRESQKMEALGTLAGGVAHDFNNIIAAIMGNVELARQDVGHGHLALESLDEIGKASLRAKELVQQILAFGRRQQVSRRVISLAPVVEESSRLLRTTLPAGVELTVECEQDTPAVLADATQVEQVLLNLCNNAWHAIQNQVQPGKIELRLQAHERRAAPVAYAELAFSSGEIPPGRYACLTVKDNGSGMDRETVARIFEPFFTTKPVDKGTGLGLAVVHGIVRDHGASIEVQSAPGEGSTFRVFFPEAQKAEEPGLARTPERAPVHGQGKHVLFIDDDESIVFLMTRLLERQGYRVSGFTDAREALAAARANPGQFDLAVTDFNMPYMSGLDVARALHEIHPELPVAVASGYITDALREEAPAAGVKELVYKPNTVDELCEVVSRLARELRR